MTILYVNCYQCPRCGETWVDECECTPDMDCPGCELRHIAPLDLVANSDLITAISGESTISEADEAWRTPLQALYAYIDQMTKGETIQIIEMYERAALKAGCNPDVLRIAFKHHYQGL